MGSAHISLQICGFAGGFFQPDGGINGGEQAETPPSFGPLVMIFRGEMRYEGGHLFGEGGPGFSASEADLGCQGKRGDTFSGAAGADAERGQLANHSRSSRSEISGGETVGSDAIAGLGSDQEFSAEARRCGGRVRRRNRAQLIVRGDEVGRAGVTRPLFRGSVRFATPPASIDLNTGILFCQEKSSFRQRRKMHCYRMWKFSMVLLVVERFRFEWRKRFAQGSPRFNPFSRSRMRSRPGMAGSQTIADCVFIGTRCG